MDDKRRELLRLVEDLYGKAGGAAFKAGYHAGFYAGKYDEIPFGGDAEAAYSRWRSHTDDRNRDR